MKFNENVNEVPQRWEQPFKMNSSFLILKWKENYTFAYFHCILYGQVIKRNLWTTYKMKTWYVDWDKMQGTTNLHYWWLLFIKSKVIVFSHRKTKGIKKQIVILYMRWKIYAYISKKVRGKRYNFAIVKLCIGGRIPSPLYTALLWRQCTCLQEHKFCTYISKKLRSKR